MASSPASSDSARHHRRRRRRHHSRKHRHHTDRIASDSSTSTSTSSLTSSSSDCSVETLGDRHDSRKSHGNRKRRHDVDFGGHSDSHDSECFRKRRRKDRTKKAKEKGKDKNFKYRHDKHKQTEVKDSPGPVQLSKFLGQQPKDDGVRRSVVSGKKILMKVEKTKEDKLAENNRNELLKFLNASYD